MGLRIAPGRLLRWPKGWPANETGVLFDGASGDYWVLDPEARALVLAVQLEPGIELQVLQCRDGRLTQDLHAAAAALIDAGVLVSETGAKALS